MAIISFEHIAADGGIEEVPDGFRRLNWDNFAAVDDEHLEVRIGNTNAIRTGEAAAFNSDGASASFKSPDRDNDFDLNSGYFTELIVFPPARAQQIAFNIEDLTVKVFGFDDGDKVAKKVLVLDTDREFVRFGPQFDDIDEVRFTAKGDDPVDMVAFRQFFAVDDLFIDF